MTHEEVPLAVVFREVAGFLAARTDAVIFGAHAVNAYANVERMTQDVDVLSTNAALLAEDLRSHLGSNLHIAVRVREVVPGVGYRVYQLRDVKNRHLVDVRQANVLPPFVEIGGVRVLEIVALLAMKVTSTTARRGREKGLSDRLDVHRLLNAFPHLRVEEGPVAERLRRDGAAEALATWCELVQEQIEPDGDEPW